MANRLLIAGMLALTSCVSPHGMQAVGTVDDAGCTYHYAQACSDEHCAFGLGSAALYCERLADGSTRIVPLGSTGVTSSGALLTILGGVIAAGAADGLTHNPSLVHQ